jgi:sulfur relay (sulfurtransferase) complex TusBCD TusD component (DsrE family)
MTQKKTLTFVLNDPPFENARSTTALRLVDIALRRGFDVNVFAYEGAVALPFAKQAPHGNTVHGRDVAAEDHPLPREWVTALVAAANQRRAKLDWVNCGLCVDERGVGEAVAGTRRGSPADLAKFVEASDNTLVIPTK